MRLANHGAKCGWGCLGLVAAADSAAAWERAVNCPVLRLGEHLDGQLLCLEAEAVESQGTWNGRLTHPSSDAERRP